jgi:hypothetical protein
MRVLKWIGIGALILIVFPLGYCALTWPRYSWHQKMTIEVEQHGQLFTGSSVTAVDWWENDPLSSVNGPSWLSKVKGEAVVVELPGPKYLFALLSYAGKTEYTALVAPLVMKDKLNLKSELESFPYLRAKKNTETLSLQRKHYPFFAVFEDINNPASVKEVHPLALDEFFGPDTKIKRITIEITDEPVTRGRVEQVLGWLDKHIGRLDGNRYGTIRSKNRFANSLSAGAFTTERTQ